MVEENVMVMLGNNYNDGYGEQNNPIKMEDHHHRHQQTAEAHSHVRLMKMIADEFVTIKDSMEMFPLPANNVELQNASDIKLEPQVGEVVQGTKDTDLLMSLTLSPETNQHKIKELAQNAMDEVSRVFIEGEPLWQHDLDRGIEVLNTVEYDRKFSSCNNNLDTTLEEIIKIISVDTPLDLPNLDDIIVTDINSNNTNTNKDIVMYEPRSKDVVHHGSREVGYVQMPAISIVEMLMDVRLWSFVFSEMLSKATVLGTISPGAPRTFDGALHMMAAEYHAPSPLFPTQQSCFARYCKELSPNTWTIVDISLESLITNPLLNNKRRPSGCLIQGLLDGNTQVTWIEHTETEIAILHPLLKDLVSSGLVFSAKHWVDTLARQCQHLDMLLQNSLHGLYKEIGPFRVEGLLRLAERMRRRFCGSVSAAKANGYKPISIEGGNDLLIKVSNRDDQNTGLLTVTTSSCFPFSAKKVFRFLGNVRNRIKWDALALEHSTEEVFHVHSNQGSEDTVSITKMVDKKGGIDTLFVQQKHENAIASYIIFSPITHDSLVSLSKHGNIDEIPLIPSGFAILSKKDPSLEEESVGSIVTLSFQLLDSSLKTQSVPKKSTRKVYSLVNRTMSSIRAALSEAPEDVIPNGIDSCKCVQRKLEEAKQTNEAISNNNISGMCTQESVTSIRYLTN